MTEGARPSATLYGLGIGPGDPDLITVKARDILARVPVIAYPAPEGGPSLARAIAAPHIPPGRIEIVIETPMAAERFPAQDVYDRYAAVISGHLACGRDVGVLCEGDPFLYGSFMYLFERIAERHASVVVPGVSSLAAVAAVAGQPLASRNEVLTVLPATLPENALALRIACGEALAIMKVGRHLAKIGRVLRRFGLDRHAWYVERATMANQRILPLAAVDEEIAAPYFSMVLVRRAQDDAANHSIEPASDAFGLPQGAAIIALTATGLGLARRLQTVLPESRVHGLWGRTRGAEHEFTDTIGQLRDLFTRGTPIVALCAAGIVIRAVAPVLSDKRSEPAVVAVAEDGSVAVPLLGGHHGANRLARAVAALTGGIAAITTGGEVRFGFGLDDPPPGWRIVNPEAAKPVAAALLAGEPVALSVEAGDAGWLTGPGVVFSERSGQGAGKAIIVTDRAVEPAEGRLVLHPPVLAVGIGCERGADPDEVLGLVERTLERHGLAREAVACVVSVDIKMDEAAVHGVAAALGVSARFFSAARLEAETPRLANPSEVVFREVGCHGVAEGAALAAVGPDGALVVEKTRSAHATCALARAPRAIDPLTCGRPQGRLSVVGIGPGGREWRTPEATSALWAASDIVGLPLYLDLVSDLIAGKRRHASAMSEEETRVRLALDLAAEGRPVALISSGDAGIYGMAALMFELLDRENRADWNRIHVTVAPGLSALQAAAARVGAPLGHDFCAISLSDLLTPWADIERRLAAAAAADFVVALYNPVSKRRRAHLVTARDILLQSRPAETPVVLARNLGRQGETVDVIRLDELHPERVDMLTLVLVGSSRTRLIERGVNRWVYTPRGYSAKLARSPQAAPRLGDR
jgi:cobalt-precorrin 5A hydrolase/precorrin-3B C17-methyltransferase